MWSLIDVGIYQAIRVPYKCYQVALWEVEDPVLDMLETKSEVVFASAAFLSPKSPNFGKV